MNVSASEHAPSRRDTVLLIASLLLNITLFVLTCEHLGGWFDRSLSFGDNSDYALVAEALRTGSLGSVTPKHFWGFPAAVAIVSRLTGVSVAAALVGVSITASIAAAFFVLRLFGLPAALIFSGSSVAWIQRTALGGAEPLFLGLILAGMLAHRAGRSLAAVTLGALATTVRPVGIFWVFAVVVVLAWRRDWRRAGLGAGAALVVLAIYALPFLIVFNDPLANVRGYQGDFGSRGPIGIPFAAIYTGLSSPALSAARPILAAWMGAVLVTLIWVTYAQHRRSGEGAGVRAPELVYLWAASAFLFIYSAPGWSAIEFPRFCISVLPFIAVTAASTVRLPVSAYFLGGQVVSVVAAAWAFDVSITHLLR